MWTWAISPAGTGSIGDLLFEDVGNDGVYNVGTDTRLSTSR